MSVPARPSSDDTAPQVDSDTITFRLRDPEAKYEAVGLMQDLRRPRDCTPFTKQGDEWVLSFPRLAVDRMEYQFKGVFPGGTGDEVFCDPANAHRVPGAFGDKSVLILPGYMEPRWLHGPAEPGGESITTAVASRTLRADIPVRVWTSAGADVEAELPVLVAHDGREYAEYSGLLRFVDCMTSEGRLPPMRAVLLEPPWPRDEHYSAAAAYARALVTEILPAVQWLAPTPSDDPRYRVGMGASLGALAMLHAHRLRPHAFGGCFLQSGSYFRQRYDKHESGFPRFRRISRFVGEVLNAESFPAPVPVVITCGRVEENLNNNRAIAAALRRQGYPVEMVINRDAHNYVGWRDTFEPHLVDLLAGLWGAGRRRPAEV